MHQAHETGPSDRYLGHRQACKHSPGSDPITGTGSASQLVLGLHLRNPSSTDYYSEQYKLETVKMTGARDKINAISLNVKINKPKSVDIVWI